jgi:catechol 2,3-dioxygenase-like lactoylglutathione lyase family enzyme
MKTTVRARLLASAVVLAIVAVAAARCGIAQERKPAAEPAPAPAVTLGLVQINVVDLEEAKRFYVDLLGFQVVPRASSTKVIELRSAGGPRILLYRVEKKVANDYPRQTGTTLIFAVQDLNAVVDRLKRNGVEFIPIAWSREPSGIAWSPYGRFIAFRDPSGNVHELIEPPREGP